MLTDIKPIKTRVIPENVDQLKSKIKALEFKLLFVPDYDENTQIQILTEIQVYRRTLEIIELMD